MISLSGLKARHQSRVTSKPAAPLRQLQLLRNQRTLLTLDQMMVTVFLNGALGFIMIVTFCFAIQSVEEQVIMSTSPYPFVDIFATATGSTAAAIGMTVPMVRYQRMGPRMMSETSS
jgi:hypothetical protein